jgi:hypothetical protein
MTPPPAPGRLEKFVARRIVTAARLINAATESYRKRQRRKIRDRVEKDVNDFFDFYTTNIGPVTQEARDYVWYEALKDAGLIQEMDVTPPTIPCPVDPRDPGY